MRWTVRIGGFGLLLAALASTANAQTARPTHNAQPYSPGYVVSPGCQGPGVVVSPHSVSPVPGTVMPGPVSPAPGTVMPSPRPGNTLPPITPTPGTTPTPSNTPTPSPSMDTPSLASAAPAAGSSATGSSAPNMIGDFGIGAAAPLKGASTTQRVPIVSRGGFKISENESPRPQCRVFFNYNYFNNAQVLGNTFNTVRTRTGTLARVPGSNPTFDLHRETFGFERAFMEGNASIGARLPLLQVDGLGGVGTDGFGDLTVITKYAFINNCDTGDVVSGGVAITAPTGRKTRLVNNQTLDAWLIQPYAGFILNQDRFFVQGFTAVIFSTEQLDVDFFTADIGVGFRAYCGDECDTITQLIPTLEIHANIPLENRGNNTRDIVVFPDQFILTGGVHIGLWNTMYATLGCAIPLSGPKPYDFEILAQFNVKF